MAVRRIVPVRELLNGCCRCWRRQASRKKEGVKTAQEAGCNSHRHDADGGHRLSSSDLLYGLDDLLRAPGDGNQSSPIERGASHRRIEGLNSPDRCQEPDLLEYREGRSPAYRIDSSSQVAGR